MRRILVILCLLLSSASVASAERSQHPRATPLKSFASSDQQLTFLYPAHWQVVAVSRPTVVASFEFLTDAKTPARLGLFSMNLELGEIPRPVSNIERPLTLGGVEPISEEATVLCDSDQTNVVARCALSYTFKNRSLRLRGLEFTLLFDMGPATPELRTQLLSTDVQKLYLNERRSVRRLLSSLRFNEIGL